MTSFSGKKWAVRNEDETFNIIAKLLQNRGIDSPDKADRFFGKGLADAHDPYAFSDMNKAAERIKKAAEQGEKIMVFGDYDVDGVTATAIVYDFLKKAGADAHFTLPHRDEDGYGLKPYFIDRFRDEGVTLIITVDCGTSNADEIQRANDCGIDVIVTDHHTLPERLPNAHAVINPRRTDCAYPNKDISGAGIAYKLASALAGDMLEADEKEGLLGGWLALAALGIVADCMPLKDENRTLVREGLKHLAEGKHPAVLALLEEAGLPTSPITSSTIGFQIAPRLNAAGRMDSPEHAFFLLTGDTGKAAVLNALNEQRRETSKECIAQAVGELKKMQNLPPIITVRSPEWRIGLLGLIAGDLVERFHRPTIAMTEKGDEIIASMRSISDVDLTGLMRQAASELFTAFGGHAMAGGFTLKKDLFNEWMRRVEAIGREHLSTDIPPPTLAIDCAIEPDELTGETVGKISRLEPFGSGNPEPTLLIRGATIGDLRKVGKTGDHLSFTLRHGPKTIKAIAFRFGEHFNAIDTAKAYDIVGHLGIHEWNGKRSLQLRVVDMRPSDQGV